MASRSAATRDERLDHCHERAEALQHAGAERRLRRGRPARAARPRGRRYRAHHRRAPRRRRPRCRRRARRPPGPAGRFRASPTGCSCPRESASRQMVAPRPGLPRGALRCRAMAPRLSARSASRDNVFDVLRLAAAMAVLFSHCYPLTGRDEPVLGVTGETLGDIGVSVFFAISGFLVTRSFMLDSRPRAFAAKRALRLLPALIVCVWLLALVLGPLTTTLPLSDYLTTPQTWIYPLRSSLLVTFAGHLPGVFGSNPLPDAVDGSLWTAPGGSRRLRDGRRPRLPGAAAAHRGARRAVRPRRAGDLATGRPALAPARRRPGHGGGRQPRHRPPCHRRLPGRRSPLRGARTHRPVVVGRGRPRRGLGGHLGHVLGHGRRLGSSSPTPSS